MTSPFAAKAADAITTGHRHESRVTARPLEGAPFPLEVEGTDLSVTFDESWSPYAQTSLGCIIPSVANLDRLDPRRLPRIEIEAGYTYPDGTSEILPLANVGLKDRRVSRPSNTLKLESESDESFIQEYDWTSEVDMSGLFPDTGINDAVNWVLGHALPNAYVFGWLFNSEWGAGAWAVTAAEFYPTPGTNLWSILDEIAAATNSRIYCDGDRVWRIRKVPEYSATPQHSLTVGENGTILSSDSSLSRDGWYNAASIRYKWDFSDTNKGTEFGYAKISSGSFAVGTVGRKLWSQVVDGRRATKATLDSMAAKKLRKLVSRGRSLELEAIAAYWLRPGDTIRVTLPTGDPELHLIERITFRPLVGLMNITTRQPFDVEITTGE